MGEARVAGLPRARATITEAAGLCGVPYDTVRLVIDGATINRPRLARTVLMDGSCACSRRDGETGKLTARYWCCVYNGADGRLIDMPGGRGEDVIDRWFERFSPEERNKAGAFCTDMWDPRFAAARKWLPLAIRAVDRFHVAKAGVARMNDARKRLQPGAGNGADPRRRARKPAADRGKRRREHGGEKRAGAEKGIVCNVLCHCDEKHSLLRQAYLALQPCHEWQDRRWDDRMACDDALRSWTILASGIPVPEMNGFASTVNGYRQQLVTGTVMRINSARAESTNDKIKELKRRSRGFGGFDETCKRLLLAFGRPDAAVGATERARRLTAKEEARAAKRRGKKRR